MELTFKEQFSFDQRKEKLKKFQEKYPGRIPVVLQNDNRSPFPPMKKHYYLFGSDVTCSKLMVFVRKQISIGPEMAMWLFVDGVIPSLSATIGEMYEQNKADDGFLYVVYCGELTFG